MSDKKMLLEAYKQQLKNLELELLRDPAGTDMHDPEYELLLQDLKDLIDNLRNTIWCHFLARAKKGNVSVKQLVSEHRVRRVMEMLSQMHQQRISGPITDGGSVLVQLESMAEQTMVKNRLA